MNINNHNTNTNIKPLGSPTSNQREEEDSGGNNGNGISGNNTLTSATVQNVTTILETLDPSDKQEHKWSTRKRRNTRRMALRIIKKFESSDQTKVNDKQLSVYNWAKGMIVELGELEIENKSDDREEEISAAHGDDDNSGLHSLTSATVQNKNTISETLDPPDPKEPKWSARKKRNTRRLALKVIQRFEGADQTKATDEELSMYNWSKEMIARVDEQEIENKNDDYPLARDKHKPQNRRRRSSDDISPIQKCSKMPKIDNRKTFSEINGTVMAVIDRSAKDGRIVHTKWCLLEAALSSVFSQIYREMPGSPPKCRDAGWFRSILKLVAFGDDRSIAMYKAALLKIGELWPGAELHLVSEDELPIRPRAWTWIPHTSFDKETIQKILIDSNPNLPICKWDIEKLDEVNGARIKIYLLLSVSSLTLLAKTNGVISYAFGQITINVYKKDKYILNPITNYSSTEENLYITSDDDLYHSDFLDENPEEEEMYDKTSEDDNA